MDAERNPGAHRQAVEQGQGAPDSPNRVLPARSGKSRGPCAPTSLTSTGAGSSTVSIEMLRIFKPVSQSVRSTHQGRLPPGTHKEGAVGILAVKPNFLDWKRPRVR
mmetsp:Transcript_28953/g.45385  ORF Transcript_28953/g.45385 Transcript_28953/m.45385 type:complete len:106 (+) Transcript_28953:184-501(+)